MCKIKELFASLYPRERGQAKKLQTRYTYRDGPMVFLGQQIVRGMQQAGYPAKIHTSYRSPVDQNAAYVRGASKARAWDSPHQYLEAVDIIHASKGWDVSDEFWETLAGVVEVVAEKYGIDLEHGHNWRFTDSAHVELKDWRKVRARHKALPRSERKPPTPQELAERFKEVLPKVWAKRPASAL